MKLIEYEDYTARAKIYKQCWSMVICKDTHTQIYTYIYINIMRGKKGRNYISRQACFVNRFEAIHKTGLSGNEVASLFPSHNIYSALLQHIEHCSTWKSTCRLPIYIYIYTQTFCKERLIEKVKTMVIYIYIYIYDILLCNKDQGI